MIAGAIAEGIRLQVGEARQHIDLIPQRREWLQNGGELEFWANGCGVPLILDDAVRNIDETEPRRPGSGGGERGRGGGLVLDRSYTLPPVNFTAREAALLVAAWLRRRCRARPARVSCREPWLVRSTKPARIGAAAIRRGLWANSKGFAARRRRRTAPWLAPR